MEKAKVPWVIGFLLFGLVALGLSFWLQRRQETRLATQFRVAQVEQLTGQVWILSPGFEQKYRVRDFSPLASMESVETDDTGEARLIFDNTAVIRVFPESQVLVERVEISDGFQDTLILQRGDIRIEEAGRADEFFISKNGQRVPAQEYHKLALATEPLLKPTAMDSNSTPAESGLSEDEIFSLVGAQRVNFMKCYTSLLQKQSDAQGEILLNFTIENNGKIGLIEVNSAQTAMKDADFNKCLRQVLMRVEFRTFNGTPISTFFPLKFE